MRSRLSGYCHGVQRAYYGANQEDQNHRDGGLANRPWTAEQRRIMLERAPRQLALPIALAKFSGLRKADVPSVTLGAIQNGEITVRTSKRAHPIRARIHPVVH